MADLAAFFARPDLVSAVRPRVLALALEYRNIANAHLSWHPAGVDAFSLSPLPEVNDMLVADKVQNRKDFELYHASTHPRRARLAEYFAEWMAKLGGSDALCPHFACADPEAAYAALRDALLAATGGRALALRAKQPKEGAAAKKAEDQPGFAQAHGLTRHHSK